MTSASGLTANAGKPRQMDLRDNIDSLRARAVDDPAAALELADTLSLHPYLARAGEIRQLYEVCTQAGSAQGTAAMAELALRRQDSAGAFAIWQHLAEGGFGQALIHLGFCLRHGIGCTPAPERGLTQYLTAAAQGNTTAFALLRDLFQSGDGVVADAEIAQAWAELAALRRFPGQDMPSAGQRGRALAEAIKTNIQGLGPRIAALGTSPEDPQFPVRFAAAVKDNFALLNEPELSLEAGQRSTPFDAPARAVSNTLSETVSWAPRLRVARQAASAECCTHLLANWPDPNHVDEIALPLSAMSPAVFVLFDHLANHTHIPRSNLEAPVLSMVSGQAENPSWRLRQPDRLAKSQQGDSSGRRVLTAYVLLGGTSTRVETELQHENNPTLHAGDILFEYALTPDGQPAAAGIKGFHTDGNAWLLRVHACERPWGVAA